MPNTLVSDNGTQFSSETFQEYCRQFGINHIFTAPYHPQWNGQAERFVDTLKRAFKKLEGEGTTAENLQTFLLNYRSTPNPNSPDGKSPAEAMFGRPIRTSLELLRPSPTIDRNTDMEYQFNRHHGTKAVVFHAKEKVYAQVHHYNKVNWKAGEIIERRGKVMYNVRLMENGSIIRSHAN